MSPVGAVRLVPGYPRRIAYRSGLRVNPSRNCTLSRGATSVYPSILKQQQVLLSLCFAVVQTRDSTRMWKCFLAGVIRLDTASHCSGRARGSCISEVGSRRTSLLGRAKGQTDGNGHTAHTPLLSSCSKLSRHLT